MVWKWERTFSFHPLQHGSSFTYFPVPHYNCVSAPMCAYMKNYGCRVSRASLSSTPFFSSSSLLVFSYFDALAVLLFPFPSPFFFSYSALPSSTLPPPLFWDSSAAHLSGREDHGGKCDIGRHFSAHLLPSSFATVPLPFHQARGMPIGRPSARNLSFEVHSDGWMLSQRHAFAEHVAMVWASSMKTWPRSRNS